MFTTLPENYAEFMDWPWSRIEPFYTDLISRPPQPAAIADWLADWTRLANLVLERFQRSYVATTVSTVDTDAERCYRTFLEEIYPNANAADQKLKEALLASGLEPDGFAVPLRNMRAEAALFRKANLPLLSQELKMASEYDAIAGAQTIQWEGNELTVSQMRPIYQSADRAKRESAWRLTAERQLADRPKINELWGRFIALRRQITANAGLDSYRDYRWRQMLRFDYTPDDCAAFHRAIEQTVVPAARRIYEKRRSKLGVETLRPWDLSVDITGLPPLQPFQSPEELVEKAEAVFRRVDPALGANFHTLRVEGLLDVENRKNKAPGAYCVPYPVTRRPFIFANSVGLHDDVQILLHEAGHSFHVFESIHLPYHLQLDVPMEFAEVASMSMELLGSPYLTADQGGFYTPAEAARARVEHLESLILFWPYMAVVDAFQHWVYTHIDAAADPAACDAAWGQLWARFMAGVDWSGLEAEKETGWQRKLHIHQIPFYYVEYGLAQLGAVQVWANSLKDPAGAVAAYRRALSLGGTVTLPELYAAAGARFAFDADTLGAAVSLLETTIDHLSA
jgi:oligoendopeptidase F